MSLFACFFFFFVIVFFVVRQLCVHVGLSLPSCCFRLLKDIVNEIYQSKDRLKLTYLELRMNFDGTIYQWSRTILNQVAQLLIKITQDTSINAIAIHGIKFSSQQVEFFNFWFTSPFGEANINKKGDKLVLVRYLNDK